MSVYPFHYRSIGMPPVNNFASPAVLSPSVATECYQAAQGLAGLLLMLANDEEEQMLSRQDEEEGWILPPECRHALQTAASVLCGLLLNHFRVLYEHDQPADPAQPLPHHRVPDYAPWQNRQRADTTCSMSRWWALWENVEMDIQGWVEEPVKGLALDWLGKVKQHGLNVAHLQMQARLELQSMTQEVNRLLAAVQQQPLSAENSLRFFTQLLPLLQQLDHMHHTVSELAQAKVTH